MVKGFGAPGDITVKAAAEWWTGAAFANPPARSGRWTNLECRRLQIQLDTIWNTRHSVILTWAAGPTPTHTDWSEWVWSVPPPPLYVAKARLLWRRGLKTPNALCVQSVLWARLHVPTAAAVFDVGTLEQSPRANTFGCRLCCSVFLSTSTYPAASVISGHALSTSGADILGATCSSSYWEQGRYAQGVG